MVADKWRATLFNKILTCTECEKTYLLCFTATGSQEGTKQETLLQSIFRKKKVFYWQCFPEGTVVLCFGMH